MVGAQAGSHRKRGRLSFVRETGQSERVEETQGVARASLCLFLIPQRSSQRQILNA